MRSTLIHRAYSRRSRAAFGPRRSAIDSAAIAVVLLLALLFAAAVSAALHPRPPVDPSLAAVEGGL